MYFFLHVHLDEEFFNISPPLTPTRLHEQKLILCIRREKESFLIMLRQNYFHIFSHILQKFGKNTYLNIKQYW